MENVDQKGTENLDDSKSDLEGSEPIQAKLEKSVKQEKNLRERLKAQQEQLEALQSKINTEQEQKLKEQNQFKELYEREKQQVELLKKEKDNFVQQQLMAKRLNAFDQIAGKLKHDDLYKLIPVDEIVIEDDGQVNKDTVELVAKKVREKWGDDFFEKKQIGKLPQGTSNAPDLVKNFNNLGKADLAREMREGLAQLTIRRR